MFKNLKNFIKKVFSLSINYIDTTPVTRYKLKAISSEPGVLRYNIDKKRVSPSDNQTFSYLKDGLYIERISKTAFSVLNHVVYEYPYNSAYFHLQVANYSNYTKEEYDGLVAISKTKYITPEQRQILYYISCYKNSIRTHYDIELRLYHLKIGKYRNMKKHVAQKQLDESSVVCNNESSS